MKVLALLVLVALALVVAPAGPRRGRPTPPARAPLRIVRSPRAARRPKTVRPVPGKPPRLRE